MAKSKKKGHVIRISDYAWRVLNGKRDGTIKETVDELLTELDELTKRLEGLMKPDYYILPKSRLVCESLPEARGEAILQAVRKGKKKAEEEPLAVKVI